MIFDEYQEFCKQGAIGSPNPTMAFWALGVAGESGELVDKIASALDGAMSVSAIKDPDTKQNIVLEMGDTMWYATNIMNGLGITFKNLRVVDIVLHEDFIYVDESIYRIAANVGDLCDVIKKGMRGDYDLNNLPDVKRDELLEALSLIVAHIEHLANVMGVSLGEVLRANMNKLIDRRNRGVSRGDGDNR